VEQAEDKKVGLTASNQLGREGSTAMLPNGGGGKVWKAWGRRPGGQEQLFADHALREKIGSPKERHRLHFGRSQVRIHEMQIQGKKERGREEKSIQIGEGETGRDKIKESGASACLSGTPEKRKKEVNSEGF